MLGEHSEPLRILLKVDAKRKEVNGFRILRELLGVEWRKIPIEDQFPELFAVTKDY